MLVEKQARDKRRNYQLACREMGERREVLRSLPYYAIIDPVNYCMLRCPFCPVGAGNLRYPKAKITLADFRRVLGHLGPTLIHLDLFDWGEPLLNPDLIHLISEAKSYGIHVRLSTNLNHLPPGLEDGLVRSGLDYLVLSLDGVDQATYGRYRVGGDFSRCLDNLRRLVAARRRSGGRTPYFYWQYLVFRHNEDRLGEARALAREIGVDEVGFLEPNFPVELDVADWVSTLPEYSRKYAVEQTGSRKELKVREPRDAFCHWPWVATVVNPGGTVSPCCIVQDPRDDFGEAFSGEFGEVWNGPAYRAARRFIASRGKDRGERETVCHRCQYAGLLNAQLQSEMSHYSRFLARAALHGLPRFLARAAAILRKTGGGRAGA